MNKRGMMLPCFFAAMALLFGAGTAKAVETVAGDLAAPTITIDRTEINNGGTIKVTGQAPAGKPVYLEVWAEGHDVRANRFDSEKDKETGELKRPHHVDLKTGMYKGRQVLTPKED